MEAPDELDDVIDDLARGLKLLVDKHDTYAKRADYYHGDVLEVFANSQVADIINKSAQAHPLTLANIPVDALFDKIELTSITAKDTRADALLQFVWDDSDIEDEADDWHRKAGYYGDYYAIVDPLDEDEVGDARDIDAVGSSPLTTVTVYSSKDNRTPLFAVKRWPGPNKSWLANVFYDNLTVSLATVENVGEGQAHKAAAYLPVRNELGDDVSRVTHNGGLCLVVHYAVDGKPYGVPVHKKAFGPQDAITKISATNLASVDSQGFPVRWALADPLAEIDDDIDDDFGRDGLEHAGGIPNGDGMITPTSGTSKIRTVPGAIAILRGIKSVGTFDAADSNNFLKNLDWYVRAMAVATGTPLFEFDMGGDQPSGESRRRASGRINKHARKVQRALGNGHKNLADVILAVAGMTSDVIITWAPTETETDKDGLELVGLKMLNGVPMHTALLEAGYTGEQLDGWGYGEDGPELSIAATAVLAEALSKLGTAETLGAISSKEIAALLPHFLTEARQEGLDEPTPAPAPGSAPIGGAPAGVPTGKFNADGTPEIAPPKGVIPAGLAATMLPPA